MKRRSIALGAFALAALASSGAARGAHAGWWDDLDKGKRVVLRDLIAQPALIDGPITFTCVYHGQDNVFFPYFTRFTPEKHLNLTVWPDGHPVWEKDAYTNDFPFLYVTRDHAQRDELLRLPTFTRIEVTGRIRDIYRRAPWIEMLGFRKTGGTLGERVVQAMMFGDQHQADGNSAKAYAAYRQALDDASLDEGYALRVRKRLGSLLRSLGREDEANEVEGGAILGGGDAPRLDRPPAPTESKSPSSITSASDLPGTEATGPTSAPPPSPPRSPPTTPSVAPGAISSDLPGTPIDAPPTPASTASPLAPNPPSPLDPFAPPPFVVLPATTNPIPPPTPDGTIPPPTPKGTVAPVPPRPAIPLPPPRRIPRLSGVR